MKSRLFLTEESLIKTNYTKKINIPQYRVTGNCLGLVSLIDESKSHRLVAEIQQSNVSEEEKAFLISAAHRHNVFRYAAIAEYYAQATPEMQDLMEKSALVIIDYEDAIANGYVALSKHLEKLRETDSHVE